MRALIAISNRFIYTNGKIEGRNDEDRYLFLVQLSDAY